MTSTYLTPVCLVYGTCRTRFVRFWRWINYTLDKEYLKEIGKPLYDVADDMPFIDLCRDMSLVSILPEYVKPKNVALMFFNSQPEKFFPYAMIDVVQFPEGEGGDKILQLSL